MKTRTYLDETDIRAFEPEAKIGLLATVSSGQLPHVSLITSLQGRSESELMWGQFCEGQSKANVRCDERVGFLVMSADRSVWRGRARWTHRRKEGEDYIRFNQMPMFRYNSYLGIHTVHFMDLVDISGPEQIPLPTVASEVVSSKVVDTVMSLSSRGRSGALNSWTGQHLSNPATLNFASWLDDDGFPRIAPLLPAAVRDADHLLLGPLLRSSSRELLDLDQGAKVSIFALNLQMESVLIRGSLRRRAGRPVHAVLDVDWVYNTMPPLPGQIFPPPADPEPFSEVSLD